MDVSAIEVDANMYHRMESEGVVMRIERKIEIKGLEDAELCRRLVHVAENCPVSKILKGNIRITTHFESESLALGD